MTEKIKILLQKEIIEAVCQVTIVDSGQLTVKTRKMPIPYARQLICWFIMNEASVTQSDVAQLFCWADHSGVSKSLKVINEWISIKDQKVISDIKAIRKLLLPSNVDTKNETS